MTSSSNRVKGRLERAGARPFGVTVSPTRMASPNAQADQFVRAVLVYCDALLVRAEV